MKLGIGLPNTMPQETDRSLMLGWARLADEIAAYERAGIDVLIVVPQIPRLDQVEQLAEHVLPAYR